MGERALRCVCALRALCNQQERNHLWLARDRSPAATLCCTVGGQARPQSLAAARVEGCAPALRGVVTRAPCTLCAGQYEYGGKQYDMIPHPEGPSPDKCAATVLSALKHTAECGAPQVGAEHWG